MNENKNKIILITGASRGIGKEIALILSEKFTLILHASSEASLTEIRNLLGENHFYLAANLAKSDELKSFCESLKTIGKERLFGIVNNAGITNDKPLIYQSEKDIDDLLHINIKAPLMICKTALKIFMKNNEGIIVNMGSCVGEMGNAFQIVYAMTKAAIANMTKSIAKEIAAIQPTHKIRAVTVSPGFIETDMTKNLNPETVDNYLQHIPSRRLGEAAEVAQLINFIFSDQSNYINGVELKINGGIV
ncbi:MAG: SDR family NAD(P)-dependent oxidoreductase [Saprospiraceae bacterium]|nr:SDR family oxidoreductase [Saprospiraceae bacterium]